MVKLFICGDIVHHLHEGAFIGKQLTTVISSVDYVIGNLEGSELKANQEIPSAPHQSSGTIQYLSEVGFDLMLLANNHVTDLGPEQMQYTIDAIDKYGMKHIGAGFTWEDTYKPLVTLICGKKFGFINVCEAQVGQFLNSNQEYGYAWMGYEHLFDDVSNLSKQVDYLVAFVHAGLEHYSLPLPEIRSMYQKISNAGASCVIGGHPHTVQGYEFFHESFIAYSLGNFYFPHDIGIRENENKSFSLVLDFLEDGRILPCVIHHTLKDGIVELEENIDNQVDVAKLSDLLGDGYEYRANEMCVMAYNNLCHRLLAESLCGENNDMSWIEILKESLRRTIFRKNYVTSTKQYREQLLLRLFENETYRYTIIRALKQRLNK